MGRSVKLEGRNLRHRASVPFRNSMTFASAFCRLVMFLDLGSLKLHITAQQHIPYRALVPVSQTRGLHHASLIKPNGLKCKVHAL